jgi:succinate-semialdehyde dehydrogenase / glutarate-semialdehyde dehydrogenase
MGKPIAEAEAELDKCAWNCEFYATRAERFLADEPVPTDAFTSYVAYQPLGVVLAIMPWDFPFWQVLRFAAPALMAGNGALLKHSPNVPQCALAIEELFTRAGFPPGLFQALLVGDASVGEATGRLLADPRVGAVTLTGSERAGAAVGATAGRSLKKCVLELGGSDPFLVLHDADLAGRPRPRPGRGSSTAARAASRPSGSSSRRRWPTSSSGASSTPWPPFPSATRWTRRPGSGRWPGPTCAMRWNARSRARSPRERGCCRADAAWKAPAGSTPRRSWPGVTPDMPVFAEETFGPVAALVRAEDEQAAVELANDTP